MVVKKDGDWWTGVIGNRTGIFPANYVHPPDNNPAVTNGNIAHQTSVMSAEEARNQADADSEVSQINTQNVSNDAGMQEFRGMTASAVRDWSSTDQQQAPLIIISFHRVYGQRKEKSLQSLHLTKQPAASNCHCKRVSWL